MYSIISTMTQNIVQIINETHVKGFLRENANKIVVVMLSAKTCPPCRAIKKTFVNISTANLDMRFVYIDRENYKLPDPGTVSIFAQFLYTPTFVFFYSTKQVASMEGNDEAELLSLVNTVKQKIEKVVAKVNDEKVDPISTEMLRKKITLVDNLREMARRGVKLSKYYDMDSDYDEMLLEYHQKKGVGVEAVAIEDELAKKKEKVVQINNLENLLQKMKVNNYQKLQTLEKMRNDKQVHKTE